MKKCIIYDKKKGFEWFVNGQGFFIISTWWLKGLFDCVKESTKWNIITLYKFLNIFLLFLWHFIIIILNLKML